AEGGWQEQSAVLQVNLFHNYVQIDGGANVVSIANTAGSSSPVWQLNSGNIDVETHGDANNTLPCAWTYETAGTGTINGCLLNPGGPSIGAGYASFHGVYGL